MEQQVEDSQSTKTIDQPDQVEAKDKEEKIPTEGDLVAKRLINENKKYRDQNRGFKKELDDLRKEQDDAKASKLEQEGKYKEQAEHYKGEAKQWKDKFESSTGSYASQLITSQVKAMGTEMGCIDLDALIKLSPMKDLTDHVDDDFTVKPEAIKEMLEMMQKKRDWLFKKAAPKIEDGNPKTEVDVSTESAYKAALARCTTQKDFDEVRKKYRKED